MGRISIPWSEKNEIDLLSHLNFVIWKTREETSRYGSKEDILQSLESELPEPRRTQSQIDSRLLKFWKESNPNPDSWRNYEDEIYRHGTDILESLDPDLKDQIQKELEILKENQKLKAKDTPRKTRSESRNAVAESSSAKDVGYASSERTPTKHRPKRRSETPQRSASKRTKRDSIPSKVREKDSAKTDGP
jgi:hypothetical protein